MDALTFEQAISLLPEGESIHTFLNPGGMMLGADWGRESLIESLKKAKTIKLTGGMARSMRHGMAFVEEDGAGSRWTFVETDMAKLEALDPVPA